ncbi:S-methylmethionine permease [Martiniozyma asiatica (nom. inval.)]|nr:S-methylmethionine permease [Martiniozyma asiatica]
MTLDKLELGTQNVLNTTASSDGFSNESTIEKISPYQTQEVKNGFFVDFKNSFKRIDLGDVDPNLSEEEKTNIAFSRAADVSSLKKRHVQMIAMAGSIGTGLFVGTGVALSNGGPGSLMIAYAIVGVMIFCVVQCLGELAVAFPVSGSFLQYNSRFIAPWWGCVMAWNFALQWLIVMPLELVAASLTIRYWNDTINSAAWVVIFYFFIFSIHFFGVKGYGEAEFIFASIKLSALLGFVIFGIVVTAGGGPKHEYIGGKYWHNPGSFNNGFKGLCSVLVTAAFSFGGTELVGMASAETANPAKTLPSATKQVFWRICVFYITSLVLVCCLVPYNDDRLLSSNSTSTASASPFVLAIKNAGVDGLPSVINAVILIALLSVANSAVFAASRTMTSLAIQGFAPKIFTYIDRNGRPLYSLVCVAIFGLLSFLAASSKQSVVFAWMMALMGLSTIFTWGSICFAHCRFRRAMSVQGRSLDELSFTAMTGLAGGILGTVLSVLILAAEFWVSLFPIGSPPNAEVFFKNYLNAVVNVVFVIVLLGFKIYKKEKIIWFVRAKDIDVDTGRKLEDIEIIKQELEEEKAYIASRPIWYRIYRFWC